MVHPKVQKTTCPGTVTTIDWALSQKLPPPKHQKETNLTKQIKDHSRINYR